jgi:hypothetical protein
MKINLVFARRCDLQSTPGNSDSNRGIALANQQDISVPELAEYISELANELAQMAKAANCTPLAYHLEMATLEAERLTEDGQFAPSPPATH